jgi:hypothetical protein
MHNLLRDIKNSKLIESFKRIKIILYLYYISVK